jgi:hypothetical protein
MKPTQDQLAAALAEWFTSKEGNPDIWRDNAVGRLMKERLEARGNWKKAPSGNPKKGYQKMLSKVNGSEW